MKGEKMKKLNQTENQEMLKETKGGWNRCAICNTYVSGGFWKKYAHCVKHAWNATMPLVTLVGICFGIVG